MRRKGATSFTFMNAVEDNSVLTKGPATGANCNSAPCPFGVRMLSVAFSPVWAFVLLAGLTILCYHRSLSGYFLADDLLHVAFLTEVFKGHPELLIQNFFSNWVQAQGTQFYRPIISLTLAADYLVWGANAFGFHLTNLLFEIASTFFLYLTCCRLFPSIAHSKRQLMAFGAAALFAVSPLHPEVATWVIARVDSVVTTFYLLAFWLFLKSQQQDTSKGLLLGLSLGAFALALMSKEMAVALPAVLALCHVFGGVAPAETGSTTSLARRLKDAFIKTSPFWILLMIYFGVRVLALGTLVGGYQGSIGAGLTGSLTKRLTDGTFAKLLFPFNTLVFIGGNKIYGWLKIIYGLCALSLAVALGKNIAAKNFGLLRVVAFALGWFVLALLPAVQVLNLSDGLQGSRVVYLATAPLSLLFALTVCPIDESSNDRPGTLTSFKWFDWLRLCTLIALVACFATTSIKNNTAWVHAARELKTLRGALETELSRIPKDKSIALINLPQTYKGAHIVFNGSTFGVLLRPPLSSADLSRRVATFEPITYGYADLINLTRVKAMMRSNQYKWYGWNRDSLSLTPLYMGDPESLSAEGSITASESTKTEIPLGSGEFLLTGEQYLLSPLFNLSAISCEFLTIDMSVKPMDGIDEFSPASFVVSWCTEKNPTFTYSKVLSIPVSADGARHIYRVNLTEHKTWIESDRIVRLKLDVFPKPSTVKIYSASFSDGKALVPAVSFDFESDGLCQANPTLSFSYDASAIPGAVKVLYEVSKPDSWFEHYSGTYRDSQPSKEALKSVTLDSIKSRVTVDASQLDGSGFYELRIAALDANGKIIGFFSDPINFQYSSQALAKAGDAR